VASDLKQPLTRRIYSIETAPYLLVERRLGSSLLSLLLLGLLLVGSLLLSFSGYRWSGLYAAYTTRGRVATRGASGGLAGGELGSTRNHGGWYSSLISINPR
jgi:hypothetical protein